MRPMLAPGAFGTQPDVFINELPVWRSITVTRPVNRLVARDVSDLTVHARTESVYV